MSLKSSSKRLRLYQAGLKNYRWLQYPTRVIFQDEGGDLSVWQQVDRQSYTGHAVILGDLLYQLVGPYTEAAAPEDRGITSEQTVGAGMMLADIISKVEAGADHIDLSHPGLTKRQRDNLQRLQGMLNFTLRHLHTL